MSVGTAVVCATVFTASSLSARRGADDPAGHVRQCRGCDDEPGDDRRSRGADDTSVKDRGDKLERTQDDSAARQSRRSDDATAADDKRGRGRGRGRGGDDAPGDDRRGRGRGSDDPS